VADVCQVELDSCRVARYIRIMVSVPKSSPSLESFPVGAAEIAERLNVRPQTVHAWRQRRVLPEPRWTVSGQPAWDWAEVEAWARETGRLSIPDAYSAILELEGVGWAGNLDEMRASRIEGPR